MFRLWEQPLRLLKKGRSVTCPYIYAYNPIDDRFSNPVIRDRNVSFILIARINSCLQFFVGTDLSVLVLSLLIVMTRQECLVYCQYNIGSRGSVLDFISQCLTTASYIPH